MKFNKLYSSYRSARDVYKLRQDCFDISIGFIFGCTIVVNSIYPRFNSENPCVEFQEL